MIKKEKIAVIGMSGLLPGSETLDQFWDNLINNRDLVSNSSTRDFGADPGIFYHEEKGKLDKCYSLRGGYIHNFEFDASGYALSEDLLQKQDDQFKWSLYVAREALKDSGYWQQQSVLERCGVIMGNLSFPTRYSRQIFAQIYADMAKEMVSKLTDQTIDIPVSNTNYPADISETLLTNAPSALIAQAVGLKGEHYSLDAACASSLYALKLACDELHTGKADMMLAGAVSGSDPLFIHMGFSYFHAYARQNEVSAPMNNLSGGLTSAEGAGMMVLKRLSDAQKDGDRILAIIDGVGLSNDGRGKFLLSPNPRGQKLAFERAYEQSDINPAAIDYIECHATGTPLGDKTEFNSISDFFAPENQEVPLLGSAKSNMGHLLTAAGMAGMLKVILAMQRRYIPATIKVGSPLESTNGKIGINQIVHKNQPWDAKGGTPRAGINAFGFGGTNAHVILSAYEDEQSAKAEPAISPEQPMAVVGMDVHFGDCETLEDFYLSLFTGKQHFKKLPPNRWKGLDELTDALGNFSLPGPTSLKGAWLEIFDLNILRFKIQPKEAERLTLQQTLMLKVADRAIKDAGLDLLEGKGANVAVITAMESELEIHHRIGRWDLSWQVKKAAQQAGLKLDEEKETQLSGILKDAIFQAFEDHSPSEHTGFIGNIISSRISALMDFTGPAFTVSSNENAVYKALEIARNLLAMKEVDAVVLGAVDLSGSLENVLSRHVLNPLNNGKNSLGWNDSTNGWMIGEGAGAIVLKRAEDSTEDRVYAIIDDLAICQSEHTSLRGKSGAKAVAKSAEEVLQNQGLKPEDIGLLELSASGISSEDDAEIDGLTKVYQTENGTLSCALGSSKAHIGHTFSASGIASIIKTALSLYYRFIPGVPEWEKPKKLSKFSQTPFYVPRDSQPWIPEANQEILRAAISGIASDGTSAHVLLSEGNHPNPKEDRSYLLKGGERIFPIYGESDAEMHSILDEIDKLLEKQGFREISDSLCEKFESDLNRGQGTKVAVLIASSDEGLKREIQFFKKGLPGAWQNGKTFQTPSGSYFAGNPLGEKGKVALVYPGSGTTYTGMGAALFQAFPELYDYIKGRVNHLETAFFSTDLYPRTLVAPTEEEKQQQLLNIQRNALPMMATGVMFSGAYTKLVEGYLGLKADAVMGFSMGETSAMWYSQGIWDAHNTDEKFMKAPLFREKVGGKMKLLAEHWQMSEAEALSKWRSCLIAVANGIGNYKSLKQWFETEIAPNEARVYLTFIHTDTEVILSGDKQAIEAILQKYNLQGMDLKINNVVHHEFCRAVTPELLEMHTLNLERVAQKVYYSSITGTPLEITIENLAEHAKEVCCREVNFPHLVRKVAQDNHQIFVELGANATCSRWIDEILRDQPHICIPSDRKGVSVLRTMTGMVAMMLSHGLKLNINDFYQSKSEKQVKQRVLNIKLKTGGKRFQKILSETKERFTFEKVKQPALAIAGASEITSPVLVKTKLPPLPPPTTIIKNSIPSPLIDISKTVIEQKTQLKKAENGLSLQDYNDPNRLKDKQVIWDENDLLTFAEGKISNVFGPEYSIIDTYRCRVMLPMPPYLLVSRVTKLNAKVNEYKPSTITTEYDIPYNSYFATDGQIPWAVAVESGQCDLLLISYLGIDFQNKGKYMYRLLDCTLTFLDDLPFEGQTLRYDISINSFVRNGNNLLFFFSYECFVEDRMVLKMDGGCAGFFSFEDLELGQGVVYKPDELTERNNRPKQYFPPLLHCEKTSFSRGELLKLVEGDIANVFGESYDPNGLNKSLRLPPEGILMLDRITKLDRKGGSSGLGFIEAEKDLKPDDWYFPCHFRDDEVLAGSLQAEGGGQLLRFFMLYLGMQRLTKDARFQPVLGLPQKVRCRKEVPAKEAKLIYRMDVKEIGLLPEPYVVADLEIVYDGYVAVFFENLGLKLQEKNNPTYLKQKENLQDGIFVKPVNKPVLLNEYHVSQFALGPVYKCFGEEYKVYEGRNLSRQPNTDLQFISRVLEVKGERHIFNNQPEIIAEYDVPADAWYYKQNSSPVMPYSVLMEVALQPCGFLGAYLGSTLKFPDKDLFFRNLDGNGEMLKDVDLRGKTVLNRAILVSHTNLAGTVLQRYTFELSVDGEIFYKGESSFGFFTKDDLSSQAGLDKGQHKPSWLAENDFPKEKSLSFKLDSLFGKMKLFRSTNANSPQLHLADDQLRLLDVATIVKDGGKYGKGYIHASKVVNLYDWFFTCHFYQDPVMPGSLGVEAIIQAIQLFALQQELGKNLQNVAFKHLVPHETIWKYRGQILQGDPEMNVEAHIKEINVEDNQITLIADASLWKGTLRIYEVTDLAIVIG